MNIFYQSLEYDPQILIFIQLSKFLQKRDEQLCKKSKSFNILSNTDFAQNIKESREYINANRFKTLLIRSYQFNFEIIPFACSRGYLRNFPDFKNNYIGLLVCGSILTIVLLNSFLIRFFRILKTNPSLIGLFQGLYKSSGKMEIYVSGFPLSLLKEKNIRSVFSGTFFLLFNSRPRQGENCGNYSITPIKR